MTMINFIILAVITLILGSAVYYIRKAKKRGVNCIGCPDSGTCSGHCAGCSGCGGQREA